MQTVTSFGIPSDEEEDILSEYAKVFPALTHNQEVAENVFSRAAKKSLRQRVGTARFVEAKEARGLIPTWVTESSVVLVEPAPNSDVSQWCLAMDGLVECVARHLNTSVGEHDFVLVDSLSTRIHQIGKKIYRFTVKQKWALESSDG